MRLGRHDLHILTGAYALNAVDGAERDRFEHHLRRCRPCAGEVRGLRETVTRLAMAVTMAPPAQLRQKVLAGAAVTRQLPPPVTRPGRPFPAGAAGRWLAAAAVVVVLAALIVLGIAQFRTRHQLDSAQAQNQAIATVLAAPDARIVTRAATSGGTATVIISRAQQKIVFTSAGLRALPAGKVYELWLIGPPRVRPAGLLPSPVAGTTAPMLASGLAAGDKVGVTVEPAGGTSLPTTTPILLMPLPA